jgi:predicted heme/steroid binding protein/uncharacterized membrane protein
MKIYTQDELKAGDGRDGRAMLFAHAGKVYEVAPGSISWENGLHMDRHPAGADLTQEMASAPHGPEIFSRARLVGEIAAVPPPSIEEPPAWAALLLSRHLHPPSAHFPIGLCLTAALFSILNLLFDIRAIELASIYNQIVAAAALPFTLLTGYLSWRYNYRRRRSFEFRNKILLSVLLPFSMLGSLGIFGYQYFFQGTYPSGPFHALYHVLVITTALNVAALGYLGGRITYPGKA